MRSLLQLGFKSDPTYHKDSNKAYKMLASPQLTLLPRASSPPKRNTTVFTDNMSLPVHGWFRFSAGYSAEWVETLVREHAQHGPVRVLDPFVGSGTTVVATQAVGACAVGLESHPFYVRVAKAKAQWSVVDPDDFQARALLLLAQANPIDLNDPAPLLVKCFEPETLSRLIGLRDTLARVTTGDPTDQLLWLALVSIIRSCSHVGTAQWQYVLPNRRKARVREPWQAFRDQTTRITQDLRAMSTYDLGQAEVLQGDARVCALVPDSWATLVITSPPYPNNYDYADAARLEMTFLGDVDSWGDLQAKVRTHLIRSCSQHMKGFDLGEALASPLLSPIIDELRPVVAELSVLARERKGHKRYDSMVTAYFTDLAETWLALRRACAPDATVCFVIGDSAPYGVYVPAERWLGELARAAGFGFWRFEKMRDRNVKWENRKHRVPLHEGRLWVTG